MLLGSTHGYIVVSPSLMTPLSLGGGGVMLSGVPFSLITFVASPVPSSVVSVVTTWMTVSMVRHSYYYKMELFRTKHFPPGSFSGAKDSPSVSVGPLQQVHSGHYLHGASCPTLCLSQRTSALSFKT